jgi:hypothetical protein
MRVGLLGPPEVTVGGETADVAGAQAGASCRDRRR